MASKGNKKAGATPTANISNVQTPQPTTSTPVDSQQPRRSFSPTYYTRFQEKEDLQNLNNRLACYIDKVRHLELENSRLTREIQTSKETVTREVSKIKSIYDQELHDTRQLLDETSTERAKLEIDTKRLWDANEELKAQLEKKLKELQIAEGNALMYETRFHDQQMQLNHCQTERKQLLEKERELKKEVQKLKTLLDDTRKNLEEETLQRIDRENTIQSLREELNFKDQVHQQELTHTHTTRQIEISEIDGQLAHQYEARMQQCLEELREQHDAQMRANREEIELLYENKIQNLTSNAQRNSGAASLAVEELRQTRIKIDGLKQKLNELEAINNGLNAQIRELENSRESERARYTESLAALESELAIVRSDMARQLQDYRDLMDIKVALDLEIAAYRKLLESEEARLNITPSQSSRSSISAARSTPTRNAPMRPGKRKRTLLEESEESSTDYSVSATVKGNIEISEADPQGRFVKLTNKGNKEVALSGWQIIRKAGNLETLFKFHRTAKLDAGASVTVWSADIGAAHEPPANIVMKGQKWFTSDSMTTKLLNNEGEESATSECRRQQLSLSRSRHRENSDYPLGEDLHHQQGDARGQEYCRVM